MSARAEDRRCTNGRQGRAAMSLADECVMSNCAGWEDNPKCARGNPNSCNPCLITELTMSGFRCSPHQKSPLQVVCTLAVFGYLAAMERNIAVKFSVLVLLALSIALLAGCKTTPPVDWKARVGTYTYDQAVTELGPPDSQANLTDGQTVAKWVTHRSGGTSFGVGTGFFSGGYGGGSAVGVGMGQSIGNRDRVLTLTFSTNKVLSAWSKNY